MTKDPSENLLIVLAEDPVPGKVHLELAATLGEVPAAALHTAFLTDTIATVRAVCECDVVVALASGSSGAWLDRAASDVPRWHQRGEDESARRYNALAEAHALGYRRAVLLLPSTPLLRGTSLAEAFAALATHEACIAADRRGGYAFLGLSVAPREELFKDLPYGSNALLHRAETRLWVLDLRYTRLPDLPAVHSASDLDDLRRQLHAMRRAERPAATALALGVE